MELIRCSYSIYHSVLYEGCPNTASLCNRLVNLLDITFQTHIKVTLSSTVVWDIIIIIIIIIII